ncbi:MAG: hypothetical protein CMN76_18770 [Spirochaetaceae bacterium]|nr:hypothetical protein [Spirochaetaceae bacterium]|tara:strand:- start:352420 stop:352776 length:357 start_codon:yes stop_codon:yes gene_type:complete
MERQGKEQKGRGNDFRKTAKNGRAQKLNTEEPRAATGQGKEATGPGGLYRIQYNRKRCIGCGACAELAPERWIMNEKDGKAILLHGRGQGHIFRSTVADLNRPPEDRICPASAIQVQD